MSRVCRFEGCEKRPRTGGLCSMHYARRLRHGSTEDRPAKKRSACSVEGCGREARKRGWCTLHYGRWYRQGDPLALGKTGRPRSDRCCSVDGCAEPHSGKGLCSQHFYYWKRYGDPLSVGMDLGAPERYLREVVFPFSGERCLEWPHGTNGVGYGMVTFEGKRQIASRVVCEAVHGPPPTPDLQAAHSCGNGDKGCVNPLHLRWATCAENHADKLLHGTTNRGERHGLAKLTREEVREIRRLKGVTHQREIATRFGVCQMSVSRIQRRVTWAWLPDEPEEEKTETSEEPIRKTPYLQDMPL